MTPNPRCSWRAFVVLTAAWVVLSATKPAHVQAAGVRSTTAPAANQPATTRPTNTRSTAPATTDGEPAPSTLADDRADWSRTMQRLASLLTDKDLTALQRMLRPSPIIRPFASDALQTHERLLGATTGSTLLGVHAYEKVPATLATDLSDDFAAAGDLIPPGVRAGMVPADEAAARRANETAAQWLVQVLQPDKHESTGVIVLWPPTRGGSLLAEPKRATFVLVKGEKVDGVYVLRQITFGDPLETPQ